MTDSDKAAFSDGMTALGIAFGQAVDASMLAVYWQFLRDLDALAFRRAVDQAGRSLKWFPKPAELRELAGDSLKAEIAEAWGAVRAAMDKHDYTTSVDFGPLVNSVVNNIGGWLALCNASVPDLEWRRKKFEEVYAAFRAKPSAELPDGVFCRGAFVGEVVRIPIEGKEPPKLIAEKESAPSAIVRELAESKSLDRRP